MELNIQYHISELKWRFFYSFLCFLCNTYIVYIYKYEILYFLIKPLIYIGINELIFTNLSEALLGYIKLSLFIGFYISLPIWLFQGYRYLKPGMYLEEIRKFRKVLIFGILFAILGLLFFWYFIAPTLIQFFVGFSNQGGTYHITLLAKLEELIDFIINVSFITTISFGIPGILAFTQYYIVHIKSLINYRPIIFFIILIISALITPPDIISQILFAFPLLIAIELSFFISSIARQYILP